MAPTAWKSMPVPVPESWQRRLQRAGWWLAQGFLGRRWQRLSNRLQAAGQRDQQVVFSQVLEQALEGAFEIAGFLTLHHGHGAAAPESDGRFTFWFACFCWELG
jgi:hypothetical protein